MERPRDDLGERLLTFEVAGAAYALPIADVAEVAEIPPIAGIPTIPTRVGGVVNHHGDALPVVYGEALLDGVGASSRDHLLVLARDLDDPDRYGLPVDRIHGLLEGTPERCDKVMRELSNEADRIGQQDLTIVPQVNPSGCGIQRCEQAVFHQNVGAGKCAHQC